MRRNSKANNMLDSTNVMIALSVLAASLGAFLSSPTTGILSTLQATLIISLASAFFIKKTYFIPISFFLVSFLFTFAAEKPLTLVEMYGDYSLTVAIRNLGISCLGCGAVYIIKGKHKPFASLLPSVVIAAAFVIGAVAWGVGTNGTPWGYINAQTKAEAYMNQRFVLDDAIISEMYKLPWENAYACDIAINDEHDKASLISKGDEITEGVTALFSKKIAEEAETKLTAAIRKQYPNGNFKIECKYKGIYTEKLSLTDNESVSKYLDYTINILSEETAKSFVTEAEKYFVAVCEAAYPCNMLTVNGGIRTRLYYSISGNPYIPRNKADHRMSPYSSTLVPTYAWEAAYEAYGK